VVVKIPVDFFQTTIPATYHMRKEEKIGRVDIDTKLDKNSKYVVC
jgi:hypothetical protein